MLKPWYGRSVLTGAERSSELGVAERRKRERVERERSIVAAARKIAESDGWEAVTVRRLADAIEHSQPVLYSHFASRAAIVAAVAIEGFEALAAELRRAAAGSTDRGHARRSAAETYLAFAREHPRLYEAMFMMPTGLRFADAEARPELREAFAALAAVVAPSKGDVDLVTETFWAALHGLAELERSGRIRLTARHERVALVVKALGRC